MFYFNLTFFLLLIVYSLPVGIIFGFYLMGRHIAMYEWLVDLAMLIVGLGMCYWLDMNLIVNHPTLLLSAYQNSPNMLYFIWYQLSNFDVVRWLSPVLILPLVIINSVNLFDLVKTNKSKKELVLSEESAENKNNEKIFLGFANGTPVSLNDKELNQHCLIVGTTGSGKTTTLLKFVENAASKNIPLIYLDGKGSVDLINKISEIAKKHNRVFKVFKLRQSQEKSEYLAGYNPFGSGGATEWKNRIMALFSQAEGRGQEHFSLGEQNYINFVAMVLAKLTKPIDLQIFLSFLENPDKLLSIAHQVDDKLGIKLASLHDDKKVSHLVGDVLKLLELFIYSDYGYLFNTNSMEKVIRIKESMLNNEIVLFLFDAAAYPEDSRKVAQMVISDINSSFADIGKFTKCYCIFDEFASYASSNLAETISLHRSNGLHALIGTQSLTTVKLKSADTKRIAEELIACCNTYITHAINHADDAETLSKIMGTRKAYEVTQQIDSNVGGSTGLGSVKYVDEFKVHPQILKELATGEAVIYRKVAGLNPVKVKIRM